MVSRSKNQQVSLAFEVLYDLVPNSSNCILHAYPLQPSEALHRPKKRPSPLSQKASSGSYPKASSTHSSRKGMGAGGGSNQALAVPLGNALPASQGCAVGAQTRGPGRHTLSLRRDHSSHTEKPFPLQPKEPHFTQRQVYFDRNLFLSLQLHPLPTYQGPGET